jgi:hypothetical protein
MSRFTTVCLLPAAACATLAPAACETVSEEVAEDVGSNFRASLVGGNEVPPGDPDGRDRTQSAVETNESEMDLAADLPRRAGSDAGRVERVEAVGIVVVERVRRRLVVRVAAAAGDDADRQQGGCEEPGAKEQEARGRHSVTPHRLAVARAPALS